ncbi:PVC-type heme-binding CxxCH protein [Tautonia sociabilis]|uniref:C-type cytochrome n=1 Tax=Tautonia sociabilis TaxID=2080755 RepID=A0A432MQW1_9BACT|nr:PVC-type heme-binding CxxCH protein [Tautonia sociabilis]RUL89760.1 c-type cytochrome [Tautonia sociabilis]
MDRPANPRGSAIGLVLVAILGLSELSEAADSDGFEPEIAPASDEAERAIAGFRVPEGFSVSTWAAEPMLANPVAFAIDDRGRVYVAETFRHGQGVTDNRDHMNWLDDDLAATSVEDRVAMYREYLDEETFANYGVAPDRLRLVVDADGDGKADEATVFASGFDDVAAGIGAGVLARGGDVWYACIPDLWLLRDTDGDRQADVRRVLHSGYGVHVGFLGHDLHGLIFGPDGKLYFSIGDRGFNVETLEGTRLAVPHTGAVLRCDPDGSNLEVFASGLRNPQELAFDQYGNLFTVDNNSDGGDRARLVDVVEGGDSGWHMGWQYINEPNSRGPWNAENLWKPIEEGNDAAYLLPPLANLSDGPSGFAYNPGGAGLPDRYADHFFLADFRGTAGSSGIRSFAVEPKGASFRPVDEHPFFWSILATDVDFPPSGGLFVSDWVEGWEKPTKGRIYHLTPDGSADAIVAEVARLLAEGFEQRTTDELIALLGHADQRVRQRAQFALAGLGAEAIDPLSAAAQDDNEMTRLHAVWALGQIGRSELSALAAVRGALEDNSPQIRGQAAKVLGDRLENPPDALRGTRFRQSARLSLIDRLSDEHPRVRMFSAIALGKLGRFDESVDALVNMIRENADRDPYLRHSGVMGLLGAADTEDLHRLAGDESASVRLATLLVYRRQQDPELARFLDDPEPRIVLEAARAINDAPIEGALAKLAALEVSAEMPPPLLRRVLNANLRVGGPEAAEAVSRIASDEKMPEEIRVEALEILADWAEPAGRDRIVGLWRPIASRPADSAVEELRPRVAGLLESAPDRVRMAAARAVAALRLSDAGPALFELFADDSIGPEARLEAIRALEALGDPRLAEVARRSTTDSNELVRTEGLRLLSGLEPAEALPILEAVLQNGSTAERQGALATLGGMESEEADRILSTWLDRLLAGDVPGALQLDLIEAAAQRSDSDLREKLARYEAARPEGDPLGPYLEALEGGDARRGFRIFYFRTEAQCQRCHQIDGRGGEVGPALSDIGAKRDRAYLLRSIVAPDVEIAEGFETLVVATADGQVLSGIVKDDSGETLTLMDAEGKLITVPKDQIEESRRGVSAMPADLIKQLSKRDLRDLVEFLSSRKAEAQRFGRGH